VALRLAAAPIMPEREGHALAGFLDAEACFSISPNNGGRNWLCSVATRIRRDDASVVDRFRDLTGLGTITAVPARATSRPQVLWAINSRLECLRLAELLEQFKMRGRKRKDAGIWTEAVRALDKGHLDQLPSLASQIREGRAYQEPDARADPPTDEAGLLWYLGGFFSGEGWFVINRNTARMGIKLRRDDRPLLRAFCDISGLGKVYDLPAERTWNPSSIWVVLNQGELRSAVDLLSASGLRGRKRREFGVWRIGAEEFVAAREAGRPRNVDLIDLAAEELRKARRYRHVRLPERPDDFVAKKRAFSEAVRSFGDLASDPLTCTQYTEIRGDHPYWPTSGQLTATFGSWHAALASAGLAHRAHRRSAKRAQPGPQRVRTSGSRPRRPAAPPPR
jgi:hypothetical protein